MFKKEYTTNIGNLKISGSAEEIHKLANVYGLACCEYGHQIIEEIHGEHCDEIIIELENEQKELDRIYRQLIDVIRESDYYKQYSLKLSNEIESILEEIENDER